MKNRSRSFVIYSVVASILFLSCTPNQEYLSTSREFLREGKWGVNYFYSGHDRTAQYAAFQFKFNADGSVIADPGSAMSQGTWLVTRDEARNEVILLLWDNNAAPVLAEMNASWTVSYASPATVVMKDQDMAELTLRKVN